MAAAAPVPPEKMRRQNQCRFTGRGRTVPGRASSIPARQMRRSEMPVGINPGRRLKSGGAGKRPLDLARVHQGGKTFEAPVVRALDLFGKTAAGKLPHAQVILQALAADAMLFTARVGAIAEARVARLFAFHSKGLSAWLLAVNSD